MPSTVHSNWPGDELQLLSLSIIAKAPLGMGLSIQREKLIDAELSLTSSLSIHTCFHQVL